MGEVRPANMSLEHNIEMAKLAEMADRYEDLVKYVKLVADEDPSVFQGDSMRNLFSVAFKNRISPLRASMRILASTEQSAKDEAAATRSKDYAATVGKEIVAVAQDVIQLVDAKFLSIGDLGTDSKVMWHKMKGDYFRYMAEVDTSDEIKQNASKAYKEAGDAAETLPSTNPLRLGLALNRSVFHYETLQETEAACEMAKKAFDEAIKELETLSEDEHRDATTIMSLLRDNLQLWTSDVEEEDLA